MIALNGITWDHRRAIDPLIETLRAFREERPEVTVHWASRPLSGVGSKIRP